jgi:hypothetical protein
LEDLFARSSSSTPLVIPDENFFIYILYTPCLVGYSLDDIHTRRGPTQLSIHGFHFDSRLCRHCSQVGLDFQLLREKAGREKKPVDSFSFDFDVTFSKGFAAIDRQSQQPNRSGAREHIELLIHEEHFFTRHKAAT